MMLEREFERTRSALYGGEYIGAVALAVPQGLID